MLESCYASVGSRGSSDAEEAEEGRDDDVGCHPETKQPKHHYNQCGGKIPRDRDPLMSLGCGGGGGVFFLFFVFLRCREVIVVDSSRVGAGRGGTG